MYVNVIVPINLDNYFTYEVPKKLENDIAKFCLVLVPFGKRKNYTAIVVETLLHKPKGIDKVKQIETIVEKQPVINEKTFKFWQWIRQYYLTSIGDVMKIALPAALKPENSYVVLPQLDVDTSSLTKDEALIYEYLLENNYATISALEKNLKVKQLKKKVKSLTEKGVAIIESRLKDVIKPKKIKVIAPGKTLLENGSEKVIKSLKNSPKQELILIEYLSKTKNNLSCVKKDEILLIKKSISAYKALLKKNILKEKVIFESELDKNNTTFVKPFPLTPVQNKAKNEIKNFFKQYDVVLLHGVTSSGKTEIYIHLIEETISSGKQVLYLLPEIALTAQIINRLKKHFGNKVGTYHSKFSDSERFAVWQQMMTDNKKLKIILGVRSAIFLPFSNLGLIIVDEEHENTYKQFEPIPRYQARDAALMLAKFYSAKVLLGSATPSAESYYNATMQKKYGYVKLDKRFGNIKLPEIIAVDINEEKKKKTLEFSFSSVMIRAIKYALDNKEQVILFQNRRGYAPYLACNKCGYIEKCRNCDVSLTYHKGNNRLVCHYCDFSTKIFDNCPECGSDMVLNKGIGTEKIEEEIKLIFPNAVVARMDLDSMRKKRAYEKIINDFDERKIDILVGTQMVTKGLDFENVSVVGIVDMDVMMNFPDFRAFERTFQLITQVSGRAGRRKKQGLVILQTHNIKNKLLDTIKNYDFETFYDELLKERKLFKYPPYTHLVKIIFRHNNFSYVQQCASEYYYKAIKYFGNERVFGPSQPVVPRVRNKYYFEVVYKIEKKIFKALEKIKTITDAHKEKWTKKSVEIIVDTDPY